MIFLKSKQVFLFFGISFLLLLSQCLSPSKKIQSPPLRSEQIHQMDQAFQLMKNKDFLRAGELYDTLFKSLKDSSTQTLMLFNAGVAYKEAGRCEEALTRFRRLLDHSLKKPAFKSRGLLEISYVYECLGKAELALVSLKNVQKFQSSLPWILSKTVYPARLAMAHAQMGQTKKAEHYKSLALSNILQSRNIFSSEKELNKQFSRMFYLMGRSYIKKEQLNPSVFLKAFPYHQLFLLQSLFLKDPTWSPQSQRELNILFDKLALASSNLKNKKKYKAQISQFLQDGKAFVKNEKSKKLEKFYYKKSQSILNLLEK